MSRVEEAMRRAAEYAATGLPQADVETAAEPIAPAPVDSALLAREPFPLEMPDRRTPARPAPVPVEGRVAPPPPAETPATESAPPLRLKPNTVSLLERVDSTLTARVVIGSDISPASREQYRRLGATLHHAQEAQGLKVIMIASALQGEGKTLTATNLALTLSESYQRNVLLIDADLRRPALHTVFGIGIHQGLSEGLSATEGRPLSVRQVSPRLAILPAGRANADPMAGLTSERMRLVISEGKAAFDWVIVDTPPVVLMPDANLLAAMVDGAVLVVKAASTPCELVNRAVTAVGRERILGLVLNRAEPDPHAGNYGDYAYYYGQRDVATR